MTNKFTTDDKVIRSESKPTIADIDEIVRRIKECNAIYMHNPFSYIAPPEVPDFSRYMMPND